MAAIYLATFIHFRVRQFLMNKKYINRFDNIQKVTTVLEKRLT